MYETLILDEITSQTTKFRERIPSIFVIASDSLVIGRQYPMRKAMSLETKAEERNMWVDQATYY